MTDRESPDRLIAEHTLLRTPAMASAHRAPEEAPEQNIIDQRYVLERRLGSGGMGEVFRARDRLMEEAHDPDPYVALKLIGDAIRDHPDAHIALQRECRRAQTLSHPNIVRVFHFGRDAGKYYLTMELLRGQSLEQLMHDNPGGLELAQAASLIQQLGAGLTYAHAAGIVHSDVKPSNLLVTDQGVLKILDFGIAAPLRRPDVAGAETHFNPRHLGTISPRYSPLEMHLGLDADPRDDVFSAACVIYELLSGRHPLGTEDAPTAAGRGLLPPPIAKLSRAQNNSLRAALAFRRADRTASMGDLVQGLLQPLPSTGARLRSLALIGAGAILVSAVVSWGVWKYVAAPAEIAPAHGGSTAESGAPSTANPMDSKRPARKHAGKSENAASRGAEAGPSEESGFVVK